MTPTDLSGLTTEAANARYRTFGPNATAPPARSSLLARIAATLFSPLTVILLVAGAVSLTAGEVASAVVIAAVVTVSSAIQIWQTARSDRTVRMLQECVATTATVRRDGSWAEVRREAVVPGDVIRLGAGDLVPADARLLDARDLHVQQAALTGESLPAEKAATATDAPPSPDRPDLVFFGTSVVSGTGVAVVTATGPRTAFGDVVARLSARPPETEFDRGTRRFGLFIAQAVLLLVSFVFVVSLVRHRPALESLLFALALAVGLTPELLPMIVSVTLARGAGRMAGRHVVVKHLSAIQNFGSIDVLCTDKTGTLTRGEMTLDRWDGPPGQPAGDVFRLAYLNSRHETGIKSPLDAAILARPAPAGADGYEKLDEVPFDFERRRLSVVLRGPAGPVLVTKGAPEGVLACCATAAGGTGTVPLDADLVARTNEYVHGLSADGYRLIAVAFRPVDRRETYTAADETELTLAGFLAFSDPVRADAAESVRRLGRDGVRVVMISGDSEHVARHVAGQVGLPTAKVVTGADVDAMTDPALGAVAERAAVFARMSPGQKCRVLNALKARGHVVGFLGDGVNDAPALRTADVGISVNTAVDVARAAAEVILMRPGLGVLHAGVVEGRRAFGNVTKYLLMGTSSAFGNMLSMAAATAFLPFLPMLPLQVLLNNLLYDLAQLPIPTDRVDAAFVGKPRKWDLAAVRRFMLAMGPISSAFDLAVFAGLIFLFGASEEAFHTAWFVESMLTQTLVLLVIRTAGSTLRSRPSRWLVGTVAAVCGTAAVLPYTPLAGPLGFVPLTPALVMFVAAVVVTYLVVVEFAKRRVMAGPSRS